jgi:hypothetical protein
VIRDAVCILVASIVVVSAAAAEGVAPAPVASASARLEEARLALHLQKLETDRAVERYDQANADAQSLKAAANAHAAEAGLRLNQRFHARQLVYDPAIFVLVLAVVICGLWFSYLQFSVERRRRADLIAILRELKASRGDNVLHASVLAAWNPHQGAGSHSLELGPIKITSSVIGLIVLAMSLAFFFLYLDRVYKITGDASVQATQVDAPPAARAASAASGASAPR